MLSLRKSCITTTSGVFFAFLCIDQYEILMVLKYYDDDHCKFVMYSLLFEREKEQLFLLLKDIVYIMFYIAFINCVT